MLCSFRAVCGVTSTYDAVFVIALHCASSLAALWCLPEAIRSVDAFHYALIILICICWSSNAHSKAKDSQWNFAHATTAWHKQNFVATKTSWCLYIGNYVCEIFQIMEHWFFVKRCFGQDIKGKVHAASLKLATRCDLVILDGAIWLSWPFITYRHGCWLVDRFDSVLPRDA